MGFSEQLKKARIRKGFTQQQVADTMGVTNSTYCGYETGKRKPDVEKIKILANILDTSGDILLDIIPNAKKSPPSEDKDDIKKQLIENYDSMNDAGQHELLKHSKLLANSDEYKKCDQFSLDKDTA